MRAKEFLIEYDRKVIAKKLGDKLYTVYTAGPDKNLWSFGTTDEETKKVEIINNVLAAFEEADPTPTKSYLPWIAREYINGNIRRIEDALTWLPTMLKTYDGAKKSPNFNPEAKDITRLTFPQFYTVMRDYKPTTKKVEKGQAEQVYDDPHVRVIVPKDEAAACYYGQGTRWCTAATEGNNYFDSYNRRGPLYILLPKNPTHDGEKYQLQFQSEQYMDENDDPVDLAGLFNEDKRFYNFGSFFIEKYPQLLKYIAFADDALLQKTGEKIKDLAIQELDDMIMNWQLEDDYFRQWQRTEAEERGIIDPETMDEDEIIEKIDNDDELSDYLRFNDDANRFYKEAINALTLSAKDIRALISDYRSENDASDANPEIKDLEKIFAVSLSPPSMRRRRDSNVLETLADWINKHVLVKNDGKVEYV